VKIEKAVTIKTEKCPERAGWERRVSGLRRIILDLQNTLFADAVARALGSANSDFRVQQTERPGESAELCRLFRPYALLMEVTSYPGWRLEERLAVREQVRQTAPDCKIVLMCDENSERELAERIRQAKKDGLIDQFIYGSISSTYLAAVMDAL